MISARIPKPMTAADRAVIASAQARADKVAVAHSKPSRPPYAGETATGAERWNFHRDGLNFRAKPLLAAYEVEKKKDPDFAIPPTDDQLTMAPPSPVSSMARIPCFIPNTTPRRSTSIVRS